jgi:hypothetical protein
MFANSNDLAKANRIAMTLRRELERLTGWRSKVIADLICDEHGQLRAINSLEGIPGLADAVWPRDDYFNNSYFKILLRRRHLLMLFPVLIVAVLGCLVIWPSEYLPDQLKGTSRLLIVLAGMLGAGMSVAQNLLSADISARIPAQQIGSFLVWMRPAIGAAAAIAAVALIEAGTALKLFGDELAKNTAAIIAIAIAAGFSERFITQAIEKISEQSGKQ